MNGNEYIYTEASVIFRPVNLAELSFGGVKQKVKDLSVGFSLGSKIPWVTVLLEDTIHEVQEPVQCRLPDLGCVELKSNHHRGLSFLVELEPSGTRLYLTGANHQENTKLIRWAHNLNNHLFSSIQE